MLGIFLKAKLFVRNQKTSTLMKTRHHKQGRDAANEKDPTIKKRRPGRPPLIKKHAEASKQSENNSDSRNKKNSNRLSNDNEQEQINENEPLDIQSTFDFQYPPARNTDIIDIPDKSKSGIFLDSLQKDIIYKFCDNYFTSNSLLFVDETNWIKLSIVSSFVEYLRTLIPNLTPILIITTTLYQQRWYQSLLDWTTSNKIYMLETEESLNNYPLSNPVKFDIMIICREQFIHDASRLPKIAWNTVIIDDLTVTKHPLSSLAPPLKKMTFHFSIIISADFNSLSILDLSAVQQIIKCPDLPEKKEVTIDLFHSIIEPSIIRVTNSEVASNYSFHEHLLLCSMTQHQLKQYVQLFSNYREDMSFEDMKNIAKELKNASTHPLLIEATKEQANENSTSGKIVILGKILNQQKSEGRSVAIVCSSMKTVSLIHSLLLDHQIQHMKFDSSARSKQIDKLVQQFNNSNGFSVILIPQVSMKTVIPLLNANTIVAFDIDWTPISDPIEIVNWIGRSQTSSPRIYQLITKNSFEQLLFEHLWRNRSETIDQISHEGLSILLKNSAKLSSESIEAARGNSWASVLLKESPIINFADLSLFGDEPEEISEEIPTKEVPQTVQPKPTPAKPPPTKPPPAKPLPVSQFWTVDKLVELASILDNFGIVKRERFDVFGRPLTEVNKVIAMLLKHILPDGRVKKEEKPSPANENEKSEKTEKATSEDNPFEKYENSHKFLSEFSPSDFHRFTLPSLAEAISTQINPLMLLLDIEVIGYLSKIVPDELANFDGPTQPDLSSINLEGKISEPLGDDWNDQSDRDLLYQVRKNGLMNIPSDFYPQYSDQLIDRVRSIVQELVKYDHEISSQPTIITLRKPHTFTVEDHRRIINALMDFGFPGVDQFVRSIDIHKASPQSVGRYVNNILRYCASSVDDRRAILPLLAEKIGKYNTTKIPQRVQLFQQIRDSVHKYHEFPAEDLEFLSAISFHGFMNYSVSPVLNVVCFGHCSEIKLYTKIKSIFQEKHKNRYNQVIPNDLRSRLPIKLNDMQVLTDIGEITSFHSSEYVYPVNYQCAVIVNSPIHPNTQIWVYCTIVEKDSEDDENNKKIPWFVIEPKEGKEFKFEGKSPDDAFEAFRVKMAKRLGKFVPPFDGHEMFGLQSALVHRILIDMPGIENCENYQRRFFKSCFPLVSKWPIIGQFEKEPEKQQGAAQTPQASSSKFKYKRKIFGEILQPLVLDFSPLFSQEKSGLVIDLRIPGVNCAEMVDNYSSWLQKDESKD